MRLLLSISGLPFGVVLAVLWFGMVAGLAAEPCRGQFVRASWYGVESCVNKHNCRTANGERYTGRSLTAASRTLPFNARLRITYRGKSVVVRVTDRGPALWTGRSLDISRAAAVAIGLVHAGVAKVCAERLG